MQKLKCFQFCKNLCRQFQVHHQKKGRHATKSPRYENSEIFDNTKLKGVQCQDEGALLVVHDFHHEGVGLVSNLWMTPKVVICSFVRLEAHKTQSCATP
jgi:hypothetical protein